MKITELKKTILSKIEESNIYCSIILKDLTDTDKQISINENVKYHSASIFKIFVFLELLRLENIKEINFNDKIMIKNEFKSIVDGTNYCLDYDSDGDKEIYNLIAKEISIGDLIERMITISSNLATNNLIENFGVKNIQKTIESFGLINTKVFRGVEDIKAFNLGINNVTTAFDTAKILESAAKGKLFSEKYSKYFINILLKQKINNMIPKYLPKNLKIAHKTGEISDHHHDAAIVFVDNGNKYILVIFTKDKDQEIVNNSTEVIAKISKQIFDQYNQKS